MTRQSLRRVVAGATTAAAASAVVARLLADRPPGGAARWRRTNHLGRQVSLLEGPAYVLGALAGLLAAGSPAGAVALSGAGTLGAIDDVAVHSAHRGLRGHLGALGRGEVTTGAVKLFGLAVTGLAAAALAEMAEPASSSPGVRVRTTRVVAGGALVAVSANLINLLDLRPGRALKVTLLLGLPLAVTGSGPAAAAVGAAATALPPDLAGATMLGDTGANAAGALLGVALLERLGQPGRLVVLALFAALTLVSERVSFTQVIETTPILRTMDAWGRGRTVARSRVDP